MVSFKKDMFFVGKKEFPSKDKSKTYRVVTLADVDSNGNGTVIDSFMEEMPTLLKDAKCGQVYECELELRDMNSKPRLAGVLKLKG